MTQHADSNEFIERADLPVFEGVDPAAIEDGVLTPDLNLFGKLADVYGSVVEDYKDSNNRLRTVALGGLALSTQVLDRLRFAVVLVPTVSIDVLKHTHSATEAAIAGGGLFAAWCLTVGGTLTEGMAEFPKATSTFEEDFPGFTSVVEDSLPGLYSENSNRQDEGEIEKARLAQLRNIGKKVTMHAKRGLTAIGIGNTAYVAVASVRGRSKGGIHRLSAATGIDGGIMAGLIVGGVSESLIKLGDSHPELAMHIQNAASNKYLWYGVAIGLMAVNFAATRISRKKEEKLKLEAGLSESVIEEIS
jgi:hypothetical protein